MGKAGKRSVTSGMTLQMEETDEADSDGYMYEGHKYGRLKWLVILSRHMVTGLKPRC